VKYTNGRIVAWVAAFVVLGLSPMALALIGPNPEARSLLVEMGVGLGLVGTAVLALQFATSGRFRSVAPKFGPDVVLHFHRSTGSVAFGLILAHVLVLVIANPDYLAFFDPRVNVLRALALIAVLPALAVLVGTSLWRQRVGLVYEWWRASHGALSVLVLLVGLVHGLQVGHYINGFWRQGIWVGGLLGVAYLVVHTRVVRPWLMRRRPWVVTDTIAELDDVTTLELRPEGHEGLGFRAGEYVWITLGDSPFSLQQHPFSIASSEEEERLWLTAQAAGDFTSTWRDVEPNETAYLEGPFGGFTLDPGEDGLVFVAGGIGVTPIISMLRTMSDRDDRRRSFLFYGNPTLDEVVFADEIDELEKTLELEVTHVPEEPPEGWEGPSGFIDADLLNERLPDDFRDFQYYVCGPEPMMDAVEQALRSLGISWRRIYTERFNIV
jgi:predicted ferric reductase